MVLPKFVATGLRSARISLGTSIYSRRLPANHLTMTSKFQSSPAQAPKYCLVCGRLISPNHRNFAERKYCGKSCSNTRLTPLDRQIELVFRDLARNLGSVECSHVQAKLDDGAIPSPQPEAGAAAEDSDKQKRGLHMAQWRERVRRAGRRVVVFNDSNSGRYECVQSGKAVEPSSAKGEWSVRFVAS